MQFFLPAAKFRGLVGQRRDIPADHVILSKLPPTPEGAEIARVDVVIRLAAAKPQA